MKTAPRAVTFRFDEPVEGNFGAVRVYDAKGRRVDDSKVVHPGGRGSEVSVGLRSGLADGTYTATYRVISADSHPVSGGVVFSIGKPGTGPAATVSDLLSGSSAGPATEIAFGIARGVDYLAIALMLGGLAFLLLSWRPALVRAAGAGGGWPEASTAFAARARRMLTVAVVLGVLSGLAGIVLQGATAGGTSFWSALDPGVVREVLGTRFGRIWGLRVLVWLVARHGPRGRRERGDHPGAAARRGRRRRRRPGAVPQRGRARGARDPARPCWRSRPPWPGTPRRRARSPRCSRSTSSTCWR